MCLGKDNDRLAIRVETLENLLKEKQSGHSESMQSFEEKIATQGSIIKDLDTSKRKLEKEVARLMALIEKYQESEDKDLSLQSKLKSLQLSRVELKREAGQARRLSAGNQELEHQVAHAVERVVVAERRISELLHESEALEQENLTLREEKEDILLALELFRKGKISPKPSSNVKPGKLTLETSNSKIGLTSLGSTSTISPFCLARDLDESNSTCSDQSKVQSSHKNISEAQAASQKIGSDTTRDKTTSLQNEYTWKESPKSGVSGYIRKVDVLEEYLYLSASAVKINFPTVMITNDELLHDARKLPYHKVYDFLRTKMELRLKKQESESQGKSKIRKLFSWSSPLKIQIH